jgi:uncharacterized protein (TIGR00661 family)
MRILYGVQGTGNGHITRARHLAKGFAKRPDIKVDYLFTGRAANQYFDMEDFDRFETARGLSFVTQNGRIHRRLTISHNNLFQFAGEIRECMVKDYDLVINDFEPVTAWAAKLSGVPSLSVSHQAAFLHHVPKQQQNLFDKALTKYFAPTQYSLGTHWYHFGYQIIPPFVSAPADRGLADPKPKESNHILVYLPFEEPSVIREQLTILSEQRFICYHPQIKQSYVDSNIHWHPPSAKAFKHDLARCAGVVSNCGFELSTECLSLGKALLVKPLQGQYEQLSNAFTLQNLGLCEVMHNLNAEEIDEWLAYKQGVKIDYPTNCDAFVDWIANGNWQRPETICKQLWQHVHFPDHVKAKLNNKNVFEGAM